MPEAIPGFREPGLLSSGWGEQDGELIAFVTAYDGNTLGDSTSLWTLRSKDGENWSAPEYYVSGLFMEAPKRVGNGGILLGQTPGADRLTRFYYRDSIAGPWQQAAVEGEPIPVPGRNPAALRGQMAVGLPSFAPTCLADTSMGWRARMVDAIGGAARPNFRTPAPAHRREICRMEPATSSAIPRIKAAIVRSWPFPSVAMGGSLIGLTLC